MKDSFYINKSKLNSFRYSKHGISAIVTVVLLLLLAIGVFLMISGWQEGLVSDLTVDVQTEASKQDIGSKIEAIDSKNQLYFNSVIDANREIIELSIDGIVCDLSDDEKKISKGMKKIDINSCVEDLDEGMHEVLIVTNEKTYKKTIYVKSDKTVESGIEYGNDVEHLYILWKKNNLDVFYDVGSVSIGTNDPKDSMLRVNGKISSTDDVCLEDGPCLSDNAESLWYISNGDVKNKNGGVEIKI